MQRDMTNGRWRGNCTRLQLQWNCNEIAFRSIVSWSASLLASVSPLSVDSEQWRSCTMSYNASSAAYIGLWHRGFQNLSWARGFCGNVLVVSRNSPFLQQLIVTTARTVVKYSLLTKESWCMNTTKTVWFVKMPLLWFLFQSHAVVMPLIRRRNFFMLLLSEVDIFNSDHTRRRDH